MRKFSVTIFTDFFVSFRNVFISCQSNFRELREVRMFFRENELRKTPFFSYEAKRNELRKKPYFVHTHLSTLKPIRAALTSRDLSSDTKFSLSQSRVTLPLRS